MSQSPTSRVTVLLSDRRTTDDVDPVPALRALDEVVILAPSEDSDAARSLGRSVGATVKTIGSVADIAPALTSALTS